MATGYLTWPCNLTQYDEHKDRLFSYAIEDFDERFSNRRADQAEIYIGSISMQLKGDPNEMKGMYAGFDAILRQYQLQGPISRALKMRYTSHEPLEKFYARMSQTLIDEHGQLVSVHLLSHFPKFEIVYRYADGTSIYSGRRTGNIDIHYLTWGYAGDGPHCAKSFLEVAGFNLNINEISALRLGAIIEIKDGKVTVGVVPDYKEEMANRILQEYYSHILLHTDNVDRIEQIDSPKDTSRHYEIDGQLFPPECLSQRTKDDVIAQSQVALKLHDDGHIEPFLHPEDTYELIYYFKKGVLSSICLNAEYPTDFIGLRSGNPEKVLSDLGYTPRAKRENAGIVYWTKRGHFVAVKRKDGYLVEISYVTGSVPDDWIAPSRGGNPNATEERSSSTPLHLACYAGHQNIVEELLQHKVDVNARAFDANTPLILAAMQGHTGIVRLLLEHGASPDLVNAFGRTALMIVAKKGDADSVRMLLSHGADVNLVTGTGLDTMTALLSAQHGECDDIAHILRDAGAREVRFVMVGGPSDT